MPHILHIVPAAEFYAQPASEPYRAPSLETEGFIHCTQQPEVMLVVANKFYRATSGEVLVLVLDTEKITSPVKFETAAHPAATEGPFPDVLFPHIYGPLNREAIVEIRTATRAADGTFLAV
ncbi:MAG: DUF952 domain-containing protein [Anaerolineales bacterium]|nr:DUF952 domain-containing protein [Anaerolineales bacterium]